ncbi:S-layer homology domain-containing protein [Brevibacillus humidisoli]|uniref:S-layer homology domain-containing protein n=1 Tax=Brevibacillus humidisoli TaxID=2895522 RepID=UPI001E39DC3D|nr:S-layer homology domain-containing protein [Brevibacillus humidisoli]UFJ43122.1 S-layer homology domain-containing protein [Brevibacillus humidisoli]
MEAIRMFVCLLLACLLMAPTAVWAVPEHESVVPFRDIEDHWAKEAIEYAYQMGLLTGVNGAEEFEPDRFMTRAEFAVMVDRLFLTTEYQLFPLTLLTENDEYGWGEGFDQPYLPYRDVDRLTWIYPSILRLSLIMERLYGPGSLQEIFPGDKMQPDQPITREEAESLLRIFAVREEQLQDERLSPQSSSTASEAYVKRAEAAVAAKQMSEYLATGPILPLLDYSGQKFPLVPEISELFPAFDSFLEDDMPNDQHVYRQAIQSIIEGEGSEKAFKQLRKLAASRFSNQVGVEYYLSWESDTPLTENMQHALRAVDEYFKAERKSPEALKLLAANVYDLALQLETDQPTIMEDTLQQLLPYTKKMKAGTTEWLNYSLYLAALEVRSGDKQQALKRYLQLVSTEEGLTNALYYLITSERMQEANELLNQAADSDQLDREYVDMLQQDLSLISQQPDVVRQLNESLRRMEKSTGIEIEGESMLSGYLYHYTLQVDQQNRTSHTKGIYQAPDKLVLQKMEMFTDEEKNRLYLYDHDSSRWEQSEPGPTQYLHEWVDLLPLEERLHKLHARYLLQKGSRYDVITEWIPGEALKEQAAALSLDSGKLMDAPAFVTKYYIERESGALVKRVWRYEELYDSGEYIAYLGNETYRQTNNLEINLPSDVTKGGR